MTGRASPGKCATRTGPCFRSSRDFDTYTTFDILPPSRFFQPIPKWERRYSIDFACFKKCLDKVAVVLVHSPMLARRLDHPPRRKSFPCILLQPLCGSLPSFSHSNRLFSVTYSLFSQNTRGGGTRQNPPFPINNLQALLLGLQTGGTAISGCLFQHSRSCRVAAMCPQPF